ncbi:hypothetical protein P175DRAFT_0496315 [Aspergillus ochraceoroseus IBT 24754]|uniref:TauD/TfdA-like domain-containing protein n=1 Tax=Aspergillus ochraceoroseus IBT 24754 TaxID=1392256 RepID=A0A2T5LMT8_9EURO|nr:uncharacterized protein P175DRAFT_0496315 [Aspergillus ochraceoroseus IBT 24754]PTU17601.1 hypothetical protein P175DRAFT_0496315 [Aspergillus ochraceoroseus IBT 24754]
MAQAYNRLSPEFRQRLHGLKAVHSGVEQPQQRRASSGPNPSGKLCTPRIHNQGLSYMNIYKRAWKLTLSVYYQVTREKKTLFVNPQFTRYIVGYKKEESDYLLKFLYDHIALSQDLQARVRWLPGTVVVWDNRVAAQSALVDWADGQRRPSGQNHAPG